METRQTYPKKMRLKLALGEQPRLNARELQCRIAKDVAILLLAAIIVDGELDRKEFEVFHGRFKALLDLPQADAGRVAREALRELGLKGGTRFIAQSCRTIALHLSPAKQEQCLEVLLSILLADNHLRAEEVGYFQFVSKTLRHERARFAGVLNLRSSSHLKRTNATARGQEK